MSTKKIRTSGRASFSEAGRDVLAFHLHRYLAHWLAKANLDHIWITVGFEHSTVPSVTIDVGRKNSQKSDAPWNFDDLAQSYHRGGHKLHVEHADGPADQVLEAIGLTEESSDGLRALIGFAVVPTADRLEQGLLAELEVHASEAIRAARRNGVRLFFDECDERDMKGVLYAVLDRLPDWSGSDVAAAVVLSQSLDAMDVERAREADFYVMAERLFVDEAAEQPTRLVGMNIDTRDDVRTVIDAAIERLQANPDERLVRFVRRGEEYVDVDGAPAVSIGTVSGRPQDATSFAVPLLVGHDDETELLGFLCLAFTGARGIPQSVESTLGQLTDELASLLRHSPLYTLSASKLRLVRLVRSACEARVASSGPVEERRAALVADVVEIVGEQTEVPAFSVGFIDRRDGRRHLNYLTSYGWSDFDSIELLVDVEASGHADSGISALAARMKRSVILAGGRGEGDHQEFKNFLWVHEESGTITDARAPGPEVEVEPGWTRLGEYYKPAREGAYATVAHPIKFHGEPLGVVALEVDRQTNWYWWTGYSGQLLWELVASELAFAFWVFDHT